MAITMQVPVLFTEKNRTSDEELQLIREMGIDNVDLNFGYEYCSEEGMKEILSCLSKFGLTPGNLSCMPLQKNRPIILAEENRDEEIKKFNDLIVLAEKVNVPLVSVAWQPDGILRTGRVSCDCSYGALTGYADMEEIGKREPLHGREYSLEEVWDSFDYFLKKTIPNCEAHGVQMALHPNDPPVPMLAGSASLIYRSEDYRRAFKLADSKCLTMKMCIGCWLEGGESFGNLMDDIEEFVKEDRVSIVHFRNVSSTLPSFYETLAEDGYGNMYAIMKQLLRSGFEGYMSVDHVFSAPEAKKENDGYVITALNQDRTEKPVIRYAYPTGYAKGLMHAAEQELKGEQ